MPPGGLLWTWVRLPSPPPPVSSCDVARLQDPSHSAAGLPRSRGILGASGAHGGRTLQTTGRRVSRTIFGLSSQAWAQARSELSALLAEVAQKRGTITYGEAARRAFGGRFSARSRALMTLLDEVDSAMFDERGIMIATLVVRADTGRPGEGYFAFAQRAGERFEDRDAYWTEQAERVWEAFEEESRE